MAKSHAQKKRDFGKSLCVGGKIDLKSLLFCKSSESLKISSSAFALHLMIFCWNYVRSCRTKKEKTLSSGEECEKTIRAYKDNNDEIILMFISNQVLWCRGFTRLDSYFKYFSLYLVRFMPCRWRLQDQYLPKRVRRRSLNLCLYKSSLRMLEAVISSFRLNIDCWWVQEAIINYEESFLVLNLRLITMTLWFS